MYKNIENYILKYRKVFSIVIFFIKVAISFYLSYFVRFEAVIEVKYIEQYFNYLPLLMLIRYIFYISSGLIRTLWRYSSIEDMKNLIITSFYGTIIFVIIVKFVLKDTSLPRSIYILEFMFFVFLSSGIRLFARVMRNYYSKHNTSNKILIIGAGDAGEMIVRDMLKNHQYKHIPIGFIDDNPYKKNLTIHGVKVLGGQSDLGEIIHEKKPDKIYICIPSASRQVIQKIYNNCQSFNIPIEILPRISEVLAGNATVSKIKPLSLEDLLQREPIDTKIVNAKEHFENKVILVTGAGGSIGSEICRQLLKYKPKIVILFERYENSLFYIDLELKKNQSGIISILGDIQNLEKVENVFSQYKPDIVFHAAANKHVPLVESNVIEAIKNNIFGTKNIIEACYKYNVKRFVLISTDKSVNPTNIMGITKKIAEYMVTTMPKEASTIFNAVRFGNVLGSNGSVIHIFKRLLEENKPLTVTHKDIKRFFMLIPEAVHLVLVASCIGKNNEILVLDMGEQIKILELAENVIRLSGMRPYKDVDIIFTGLRPGEKMYEELFNDNENVLKAGHPKLMIASIKSIKREQLKQFIKDLEYGIKNNKEKEMISLLGNWKNRLRD